MSSYRFDFNVKKKKKKSVLLSWRWRPVSHSRPFFTIQHLIRYGVTLVSSFAGAAARLVTVRLLGPVGVYMWLNSNVVKLWVICVCTTHNRQTMMCRCRHGNAFGYHCGQPQISRGSSVLIYNHKKVTGFSCATVHLPSAQPCRQVLSTTASSSILSNSPVLYQCPSGSL